MMYFYKSFFLITHAYVRNIRKQDKQKDQTNPWNQRIENIRRIFLSPSSTHKCVFLQKLNHCISFIFIMYFLFLNNNLSTRFFSIYKGGRKLDNMTFIFSFLTWGWHDFLKGWLLCSFMKINGYLESDYNWICIPLQLLWNMIFVSIEKQIIVSINPQ